MIKAKTYKTSKRWRFFVLRDDDGKEIKKIELDENQKLMCPKIRNKKRKINHEFKTFTFLDTESSKSTENETDLHTRFSFHTEMVFNLDNSQNLSVGNNHNFLSINPNPNLNLDVLENEYFGKSYSESIDSDYQDNFFFDGTENIESMLL